MPKKILVVEDEKHIARFVELELQHEGYDVTVAFEGREGLSLATIEAFDVLLLDVMLPGINGIEICRRVRTQSQVPIILITARDAVMDRVAGLDAGADDYIVKPFAIEELLARIRTILRRATTQEPANSEFLSLRDIEIDIAAYEVFVQGNKLDLTKTEYDLLKLLIEHKNRVCTREHILTSVWGYDTDIETNVVDVYIRHLRTKLPGDTNAYIETVRGVGYVMRE
ncbi:response regulator transcription factor [Lysinibacillus sp. FSL M8-0216]|uniref:Two-component system, OmpR family, response regulator ArlR n=1 Tax=Lysinibacillus fusiformis TaxID=28031 RepID=A0A1H9B824_9BACI|nr:MULTISPECIES: response regulator transcription factor [Lysinibacillus]HAU33397.1 DNA-binding response regulator [Lysinibacillus sp.]MCG7434925.1 response regulator transcription factor [Lysinibacillus fusiformis]MED4077900.1 response regulator transcription factor [Lysinibacillus fusiformis]MED4669574.1 response regulator transcription factor [Lysinibacillus fusiformis]NOG26269.1 response regulator transcription factor [Lysinibacillus fusiformis]